MLDWFRALLPKEDRFLGLFEQHAPHTITGAIIGVGSARRTAAVRWGIARSIVVAWVVTIPAAAAVAAGFYWLAVHLG